MITDIINVSIESNAAFSLFKVFSAYIANSTYYLVHSIYYSTHKCQKVRLLPLILFDSYMFI